MESQEYPSEDEHREHLAQYKINPQRAMFTIILSILVDTFGYSMVIPLLPKIASDLGAPDIMIGLMISANAIATLIFGPIWGKLSDKYGRKPILMISQAGTAAAFLTITFTNSIPMIFLARILDGVFGGQYPVIRAYISDITTPQTRAAQMGKIMVGYTLGMVLGPVLGGVLGAITWRYPPLVATILAVLSIFLTARVLVESMPQQRINDLKIKNDNLNSLDPDYGIIRQENLNIQDNIQMIKEMIDGESLRNAKKKLKEKKKKRRKRSIWNKEVGIRFVQVYLNSTMAILFGASFSLVIFKRYSEETWVIGSIMAVSAGITGLYGFFLMRRTIRFVGEKRMLFLGIGLYALLFVIYPYLFELWMVYIFVIFYGFCMATVGPLISANITKAVGPDKQGEVSGYTTTIQAISQTVNPLISTGFLEIGGIFLGIFYLTSYELIGFTIVLVAVLLFFIVYIDVKLHPKLYYYERIRRARKKKHKQKLKEAKN